MATTLKFGNGKWAVKENSALAYNDTNGNFKPLPFTFDRSTSATRVNKEGLIEVVSNNEPRIDFLNDSKGALLLEPSRTNLVTYSEDFSNWSIISSVIVVTDNTTDVLSPSGKNDASKVEFNLASKILGQSPALSGNYSGFVYVKGTQGETIRFNFAGTEENFTLTGGWDKLERKNITATANAFNLNTFGGATARTIYVWGAQLEQGSYATSYIPTQGSAVTRLADVCNNGGNDQVINSTEGVLYIEMKSDFNDDATKRISISDFTNNNRLTLYFNVSTNLIGTVIVTALGGSPSSLSYVVPSFNTYNKIALKYKTNDYALWVNGVEVDTELIGNTFAPNVLKTIRFEQGAGSLHYFYGNIKDTRIYNTALTDAELAALTS